MLTYFDSIHYGDVADLDVLVDPDTNDLFVTQTTIAKILGVPDYRVLQLLRSKRLKAALGKGLTTCISKKVTALDTKGRKNQAKAIPLKVLTTLLLIEFKKGNDRAEALVMSGFTDSFKSLVLEQCGVKLDVDTRLKEIALYLTEYRGLHNWLRDEHLRVYGVKPDRNHYRRMNTRLNQALFNRDHFQCDRLENAQTKELETLKMAQRFIHGMVKQGKSDHVVDPTNRVFCIIENHRDTLSAFR